MIGSMDGNLIISYFGGSNNILADYCIPVEELAFALDSIQPDSNPNPKKKFPHNHCKVNLIELLRNCELKTFVYQKDLISI